jgi:small conductance mechanosensitive channel
MDIILESFRTDWSLLLQLLPRILVGLLFLLIFVSIGRKLGRLAARLIQRTSRGRSYDRFFRHLIAWSFSLIGLMLALHLAGLGRLAAGLLAAGGVVAVVFGFAFREIGENLLAGFFLAFNRSFELGDLIQSSEWVGEVRAIELRYVHIRTADGCDIYIPSSKIFSNALVNFTKDGLRRPSFKVGSDYADDGQAARQVLLEATRSTPGVLEEPAPSTFISSLAPQYVELEVSFWSDTFQQGLELLNVRTEVMDRCRQALQEHHFTLSANVSSAMDVRGLQPLRLQVQQAAKPSAIG